MCPPSLNFAPWSKPAPGWMSMDLELRDKWKNTGTDQRNSPHVVQVLPEQACSLSPSHLVSLQETSRSCRAASLLPYGFLFFLLSLSYYYGIPEASDVTQAFSVC